MRPEPYFTPDEIAEELDITRRWVYEMLTTGQLDGYQKGGFWRIPPAALRRFQKKAFNQCNAGQYFTSCAGLNSDNKRN